MGTPMFQCQHLTVAAAQRCKRAARYEVVRSTTGGRGETYTVAWQFEGARRHYCRPHAEKVADDLRHNRVGNAERR